MKRVAVYTAFLHDFIGYGYWDLNSGRINLMDLDNNLVSYGLVNGNRISIFNTKNEFIQYCMDFTQNPVTIYDSDSNWVAYWMIQG